MSERRSRVGATSAEGLGAGGRRGRGGQILTIPLPRSLKRKNGGDGEMSGARRKASKARAGDVRGAKTAGRGGDAK